MTLVVNKDSTAPAPTSTETPALPKSRHKSLVVNGPGAATAKTIDTVPKELPKFITKGNKLIRAGVVIKKVPDLNESYSVFKGGVTKVFNKSETLKPVISKSPQGNRQIIINGVEFKVDPSRRKLVRVQAEKTSSTSSTTKSPPLKIPKRIVIGKQAFIRSKTGNLIPQNTQCVHYQRGSCKLAHKCPFVHDPARRLICRKYLSTVGCPKGATCNLAHTSTIHNTPVCLHFMTKRGCTNASCRYMHVKSDPASEICVAFAREGYCAKEECKERHLWQCPDKDAGRVCSKGDKCKLPPCILERRGIDVSKLTRKPVWEETESMEAEDGADDVVLLKKPDFVTGFNPRGSVGDYDPNELAVGFGHDSSEESEQDEDEEIDDAEDDDERDDDEMTGEDEEKGDNEDMIEFGDLGLEGM
ncbi:hypothetical protein HDU79_004490 [Rhizoclosmatium sp. JEL0117]|nr:hypothetical protein HDU79_004490 [Rhizoclosmatium sp. JEL0117]